MTDERRRQSYHDRQIVPREQKKGSPIGGTPLGLDSDQFAYSDEENPVDTGSGNPGTTQLPAPKNLAVVSQTIQFSPDGIQTVDVVIEFDDVVGAVDYETRVALL